MVNCISKSGELCTELKCWGHVSRLLMWMMVPSPPQARSMETGTPLGHVTVKALVSLIGHTALKTGNKDWLTTDNVSPKGKRKQENNPKDRCNRDFDWMGTDVLDNVPRKIPGG